MMTMDNFTALFDSYPTVIHELPMRFTSHEFIRELARQQQVLYVEALYACRHLLYKGHPAPFMIVHSRLAMHLENYPDLIRKVSSAVPSQDMFGKANTAALWEKV